MWGGKGGQMLAPEPPGSLMGGQGSVSHWVGSQQEASRPRTEQSQRHRHQRALGWSRAARGPGLRGRRPTSAPCSCPHRDACRVRSHATHAHTRSMCMHGPIGPSTTRCVCSPGRRLSRHLLHSSRHLWARAELWREEGEGRGQRPAKPRRPALLGTLRLQDKLPDSCPGR